MLAFQANDPGSNAFAGANISGEAEDPGGRSQLSFAKAKKAGKEMSGTYCGGSIVWLVYGVANAKTRVQIPAAALFKIRNQKFFFVLGFCFVFHIFLSALLNASSYH